MVFESKINLTLNLGITFQVLFRSLGYLSGNQKKAFLGVLWGCISMYKPIRSYTTKYPICQTLNLKRFCSWAAHGNNVFLPFLIPESGGVLCMTKPLST